MYKLQNRFQLDDWYDITKYNDVYDAYIEAYDYIGEPETVGNVRILDVINDKVVQEWVAN